MKKNDFERIKKILENNPSIASIKIYKHDGNTYIINAETLRLTQSQIQFKSKNKHKSLTYKQIELMVWNKK